MTSPVLLARVVPTLLCVCLVGCGEEQLRVGVSLGGTGQPTIFGGGTLPVQPLPSLDNDFVMEPRYVLWAPDANTQECDGLDITLHVLHQSTLQILPPGYATQLTSLQNADDHNVRLELHLKNNSDQLIEADGFCRIELSSPQSDFSDATIPPLDCQELSTNLLPKQTQILALSYHLPNQAKSWEMSYRTQFLTNGQLKSCQIEAMPLIIEQL